MNHPIIEIGQIAASDTDILNGTRLANIPYNGIITFRFAATVALLGTNAYVVSILLPGSEVPLDAQMAPLAAGNGNLDDRLAATMSFVVTAGGKVTFSAVLTGTSVFSYIARLKAIR